MIRKFMVAGAASAVLVAPALAQEVEVSGNVSIATDYMWRGVSQTNGDFAVSGGFDLAAGNFYIGTWGSNVDFGDSTDTNLELDFYGGFAGETAAGLGWDVGVIYYNYPDSSDSDLDFLEIYGGLAYTLENGLGLGGYLYFDPDNETLYADFSADYSLTEELSVGATFGTYLDGFDEYTNWSIGGSYATPVGLDLGLSYVDSDVDGLDDAVVFSVSKSL